MEKHSPRGPERYTDDVFQDIKAYLLHFAFFFTKW